MQHEHVLNKMNVDLLTSTVGLQAKYFLPCCCIRDSLLFYMQRDRVLKKLNFDLWTQSQGQRRGVRGQNICYNVAAFVITFNLNATCSEKIEF